MKATFRGTTVAQSTNTVQVDGIHYFPAASVKTAFLEASDMTTFCPSKGRASYYHLSVDDQRALNAVFVYPEPEKSFDHIRGWYGFWVQPDVKPGDLVVEDDA